RGGQVEETSPGGRPLLGRKGIGKFAGFGIAEIVLIDTISKDTGERTVFELDVNKVRSDDYVAQGGDIAVRLYEPPSAARTNDHGTTITLKSLTVGRRPSAKQFLRSLARRFLLLRWAEGLNILVDGVAMPDSEDLA